MTFSSRIILGFLRQLRHMTHRTPRESRDATAKPASCWLRKTVITFI
uniref:Uncharacterized protein n=1 Tax=Anguilla anguilla TaxID=7936 RepID=A0A0E9XCL8_ANGAN